MKRSVLAVIFLLVSAPLLAGVSYNFESVTTGGQGGPKMSGTADVEGQNMRIDVSEGDGVLFQDGTTVVSHDGGATLLLIDHKKKTWMELPLEQIFSSLEAMMKSMGGMVDISVSNQKTSVDAGGSGGSIEGYATSRYTIDTSYDFAIKVMGMNMNGSVETHSDVWSTDELASDYATFVQQRGFKTGIEGVDQLLQSQLDAMKGFPLKVVTKSKTTMRGRPQESTTTISVSNIEEHSVPESRFEIPADYSRTETPVLEIPGMQRR